MAAPLLSSPKKKKTELTKSCAFHGARNGHHPSPSRRCAAQKTLLQRGALVVQRFFPLALEGFFCLLRPRDSRRLLTQERSTKCVPLEPHTRSKNHHTGTSSHLPSDARATGRCAWLSSCSGRHRMLVLLLLLEACLAPGLLPPCARLDSRLNINLFH